HIEERLEGGRAPDMVRENEADHHDSILSPPACSAVLLLSRRKFSGVVARTATHQPLGLLVRTGRERLHLTQSELADRVGVSRSAISELEAGRIEQPRAAVFARLAKVLGLPTAALLAAAGYTTESEVLLGIETDEIAVLAASLAQLAGSEREW